MTTRLSFGYITVNAVLLWIAVAIGGFAIWPIYRSPQLILVIVAATILGSAIAIAGAVFRLGPPVVLAATVVLFLLFGVPLAVPGETTLGVLPTLQGLADLVSGVALGWKQLLTISLPVGQYEALLVPFYALIFVISVSSLSMALRAKRGDVAVVGPVILFVFAIAFGPTTASQPVVLALALLVVTLIWLVWRRWYRRQQAITLLAAQVRDDSVADATADTRFVVLRTLATAVLILALASGTAVIAVGAVPPAGARDVLRTRVDQPFEPRNYPSPLSDFRKYWQQPAVGEVLLSVSGLPRGARVRIATLDTYDGVVYSVGSANVDTASGSFTRVPYEFDQSGVRGTQVSLTVQVQDYRGVWLPTVGDFERLTFSGSDATGLRNNFFYNDTTATAAVLGGLASGESYTLGAVIPRQPSASQLSALTPGAASLPPITNPPAQLASVLSSYVADAATPGRKLVAMLDALKTYGYVSHGVGAKAAPSRSGHAADRINELLTDQQMIGDAEQYSVTAALMARELGFPARVIVGFDPKDAGAGVTEIRGSDISAWIEVDTAQYGWVTIDPNPPVRPIPTEKPKNPNQVARPQTVVPPAVTQASPPDPQSVPDTQQHPLAPLNPFLVVLLAVLSIGGWVLIIAFILLSPFLAIVAVKVRTRVLRRSAASPLEQITGGWQEFEDRVLDHGFEPPRASTRSEVAVTVGGPQPVILAAVADRATFAPDVPDQAEAELVWRSVAELTASLDLGLTRWERIRSRISLRSLRGYSVSKLFRAKGTRR